MTGPVIELDRERGEVALESPGLPPRWWRRPAAALVAVLSATVLVAAAPLPGSRLIEVARVDPASVVTMRLTGSMLVAVMLDRGPRLVGYQLADGARRWSVPLDAGIADLQFGGQLDVVDGVVLLGVSSDTATRTLAVDSASGRELWRSDLAPVFGLSSGHTVMLAAYLNPDGRPADQVYLGTTGPWLPLLLRAVDAHTGRLVWTYQVPAGWQTALPAEPVGAVPADGLVVISPDGRATTVDLATGVRRTTATIDTTAVLRRGLGELATWRTLGVYGDLLVLITDGPGRPTLAAYQLRTLGLRWTSTVSTLEIIVTRCGRWLCMNDDRGIRAIAVDTGAPAWTLADTGHFKGWADGWIYDEPYPVESDDATLVDPLTQRVVLHLGRWRIPVTANTGPVLTMLAERHSTRTWLGVLAAGPRVDILADLPDLTLNSCDIDDSYLACLTTTGQLRIWRYRR